MHFCSVVFHIKNLVDVAKQKNIKKIILISFPHVEGPTSRKNPATGRLDKNPVSVHAQTRLEEEKYTLKEFSIRDMIEAGKVLIKPARALIIKMFFVIHI